MKLVLPLLVLACVLLVAACNDSADPVPGPGDASRPLVDPGRGEWVPVPREEVAETCRLDPPRLAEVDAAVERLGGRGWAVVRYGRLCHEYDVGEPDAPTFVFSAAKTLGALVTGIAAWQTRDLPRTGRKTGPLSDLDRMDHWVDDVTFNPDALVAHVLGMVGHNPDLSFGNRTWVYDAVGTTQINRLSDAVNAAIDQDPARLGEDLEVFTQRFLFEPLGMKDSSWSNGAPDKTYGYGWVTTLRDMARLGLLILNGGVWSGERIVGADWIYKMTHPAFEDANTAFGYLTWLTSRANWFHVAGPEITDASGPCRPAAIWDEYPHEPSGAPDCGYAPWADCEQQYDVGMWYAAGFNGQYVFGHPGLDMVVVAKDLDVRTQDPRVSITEFSLPLLRAVAALDPTFAGDEAAFCEAYGANRHAPDLRR
ncbi:MAG: hypothetical protein FJZ92_09395 [Chloroflexi bacterium]|nr:hypothetical protein [Chloroflexota bacterium]